jgi:dihydroflavonol-4-reductase
MLTEGDGQEVVLTGVYGFLGRWIAAVLLQDGYSVCGTIRADESTESVLAGLRDEVDSATLARLRFAIADLDDPNWNKVMQDADAVVHTAAEVPVGEPRDAEPFVRAAVAGTEHVLRSASAAGIKRVVMTSSMAAIIEAPLHAQQAVLTYGPQHWSDISAKQKLSAYSVAKTKSEQHAWAVAEDEGLALTTICPGMIFGPLLGGTVGASMGFIKSLLTGAMPRVPPTGFEIVDVRDAAAIHVQALKRPETVGKRIVAAAGYRTMLQLAEVLHNEWPDRPIPNREMPGLMVRVMSWFVRDMRPLVANLNVEKHLDGESGAKILETEYRSPAVATRDGAQSLIDLGLLEMT